LTYVGAVATAEALRTSFSLEVELKWPNDILVKGRKLAGLLNEVKAETDRIDFVVLGFGVNLNMEAGLLPQALREKATSVMMELGRRVLRVEFTRSLLVSIETWYGVLLSQGAQSITTKWDAIARIRGKPIEVRSFDRVYRGVAEGLDRDGALVLRESRGGRVRIVAGDLSEAPRS
jgi:BirA family biotin operon repressor/biotin-[acetyl-CoA-carboxylase] ligase